MNNQRFFKRISPQVLIIGFVGFFIQFSATIIYSTAIALNILPINVLILMRSISEPTSTLFKVFSGYLSDFSQNRKNFLLGGYGTVSLIKVMFFLAICKDLFLFKYISRQNFYIGTHVMDRIINSTRDAPRDALITESTPHKEDLSTAFASRKFIASAGSVLGGILAFFIVKYNLLTTTQVYALSLILVFIGSSLIFLIKDVNTSNKKTTIDFKNLISYIMQNFVSFIGLIYISKDLFTKYGMILFIPFMLSVLIKKKNDFSWIGSIISIISFPYINKIDERLTFLIIFINLFILGFQKISCIRKNWLNIALAFLLNVILYGVSGNLHPLIHLPLFKVFYLSIQSFFKSDAYFEIKNNLSFYKPVVKIIGFSSLLVAGKLNDTVFFLYGNKTGFDTVYTILFFVLIYISIMVFSILWKKIKNEKLVFLLLVGTLILSNLSLMIPVTFVISSKIIFILGLIILGAYSSGVETVLVSIIANKIKESKAKSTILGLFFTIIGFASILSGIGASRIINAYSIPFASKFMCIFPILSLVSLIL